MARAPLPNRRPDGAAAVRPPGGGLQSRSLTTALHRLGVDITYLVPGEVGGTEVYARELLAALNALEPSLELVVYCSPEARDWAASQSFSQAARVIVSSARGRSKPLRVGAELSWLPARLRRDRVDLLHCMGFVAPPFAGVPRVVTVHDVIYLRYPETFSRPAALGLKYLVPLGARRAERVIAVSEAARSDLIEDLRLSPDRIDVAPNGFGTPPSTESTAADELRRRFDLGDRPVVLTVSSALRHKNLERLIEAHARGFDGDSVLVIVGLNAFESQALRNAAAASEAAVRFTGWVSQPDLEGLYGLAQVFAYPSLLEGFGMPLLEAMARGVPVCCSDIPVLREVAGQAAQLFDPLSVESIAASIAQLLGDASLRDRLVAAGRERVALFTWERAARATLASYERALEPSSNRATRQ